MAAGTADRILRAVSGHPSSVAGCPVLGWPAFRQPAFRRCVSGRVLAGLICLWLSAGVPAGAAAPRDDPDFSRDEALRMVGFTFDVVAERHLDPLSGRVLALDTLRGLTTLDPSVSVSANDQWIQLLDERGVVASYSAPPDTSLSAWARITVDMTQAARKISHPISDAGAEEIYQALFDALVSRLDPYSRYAGQTEASENRANRNGFGGIGIRYVLEDGKLAITEVMPDTPAADAGIRAGDLVTSIDGTAITKMGGTLEAARQRLRGPINSPVNLGIERPDGKTRTRPMEVTLRRGLVVPQTVFVMSDSDSIAHIRISSFNHRTAKALEEAVTNAVQSPRVNGLLLDLRGNPGRLLDQAVAATDLFMDRGKIVTTRGRHPEAMQSYSAHPDDIAKGLPIVVLVDGKSASAAEILATALEDSGRAVVAGTSSYGKGTVQTVVRLPNDGELTLTWSRFHSPTGYALEGLGVMPGVCIYDQTMTPDLTVQSLARSVADLEAFSRQWRSVAVTDASTRAALRNRCPPGNHSGWSTDVAVGKALLRDGTAYSHAQTVLTPPDDTAALHR